MKADDDQKRFDGTMAAVDEAMLAATRAEIAAGLRALGIDPASAASGIRTRIEAAVRDRGKRLMQAAVEQVRRDREFKVVAGGRSDAGDSRAKLARLLARPGVPTTLAARDGRSMSDADIESLIQDLAELGITEDEQP
jgi:hypothetical protein